MDYPIFLAMAYPISKMIICPIYNLWIREVYGVENLPRDTPFIIAANHTSYFDAFLLPSILVPKLNKKMCALIDSTYWRYPLVEYFMKKWGGIPLHVNKEKNAQKFNERSMQAAVEFLRNGRILMMFPEGGRSKDGRLQKAFNGIARLALESKAAVVPAGIKDAHKVWPKGKKFPTFNRCEVRIGKPIHFEKYYEKKPTKKILEEVTRSIMKEIASLIGQKYNY